MCGIAGIFARDGLPADLLIGQARAMANSLHYRGPDGEGVWAEHGVALAHRRLAIVDLSPAGNQPMSSADGRFIVCYNGEIYNSAELRAELIALGARFKGHSDTEVLSEGLAHWGLASTVERLNGMFAFAAWDRSNCRLALARDRLGIKPLYWLSTGRLVLFASELKALRRHSGWTPEVNRDAVAAFLRHNYIPAPHTIYRNVRKLEPGHILVAEMDGTIVDDCYWSARDMAARTTRNRPALSPSEAVDQLEALLTDGVRRQMVADVPLGAFLSGGIDSSVVTALMQAAGQGPVRTFSIGFHEAGYDEAPYAAAIAHHLGTTHTQLYAEPAHALDLVPLLPEHWDEPFADSSQLPTLLLAKLTRDHVTVALSGDGGDELFAGYNRYNMYSRLSRLGLLPRVIRRSAAKAITAVSPQTWDRLGGGRIGDKLHKLASVLDLDGMALYRRLVSHWTAPNQMVPGGIEPQGLLADETLVADIVDPIERMQLLDLLTYLPDDILTKVDRATMAASLEARVPLLDHRVVEFAWSLPLDLKLRGGTSKWVLRQVLARHVPLKLVDRPKTGFGVPIGRWLKGPLRDWAESLLDERRLAQGGLVDPAPVRRLWAEHLSGQRNWQYLLWDVLMLEAWRERWMG